MKRTKKQQLIARIILVVVILCMVFTMLIPYLL